MGDAKFGVFLSLERPEFTSIINDARLVESLGYDSVWLADHVIGMYKEPGAPRFECWTSSTAIIALTSRLKLGQLVLCNLFRHPSLLAKMAASLDNLSGGRLILGLGTGWHEGELRAYGYDFEGPETRVRRLNEAASIIKTMWTEESPTFKGRHYTIEKAHCTPKPAQKPHPPLLIAGAGEQLTLKTVARYADISNYAAWTGSYEDFRAKSDVLNRYCDRIGRDPREILRSWAAYCLIEEEERSSDMSADQYTQKMQSRYSLSSGRRPPLCGNPEQVIGQVENYIKAGVDLFMIRFMGGNFVEEASLFAREVLPHFT